MIPNIPLLEYVKWGGFKHTYITGIYSGVLWRRSIYYQVHRKGLLPRLQEPHFFRGHAPLVVRIFRKPFANHSQEEATSSQYQVDRDVRVTLREFSMLARKCMFTCSHIHCCSPVVCRPFQEFTCRTDPASLCGLILLFILLILLLMLLL